MTQPAAASDAAKAFAKSRGIVPGEDDRNPSSTLDDARDLTSASTWFLPAENGGCVGGCGGGGCPSLSGD